MIQSITLQLPLKRDLRSSKRRKRKRVKNRLHFHKFFPFRCSHGADHRASHATMVADISQLFRVRHLGSKLRRIGLLMALLAGLCYLSQGPTVVHPSVVPQVDVQGQVIKKFCLYCVDSWSGVGFASRAWSSEATSCFLWRSPLFIESWQHNSHLHSNPHICPAPAKGGADKT